MSITIKSPQAGATIYGTTVISGTATCILTATIGGSITSISMPERVFNIDFDTTQMVNGDGLLTVDNGIESVFIPIKVSNEPQPVGG